MKEAFRTHYEQVKPTVIKRLKEFESFKTKGTKEIFEEMAYCVFAANSSATMATTALDLLKPILWTGTLEDYQKAVHKKVRFYNVRSKYLHHNRQVIERHQDFKEYLDSLNDKERREFIKENFKGFGMKEASHFLRNIGYKGYTIIDKHVLNMMHEMTVLRTNKPPKNKEEYYEIENKIIKFAKDEGYDIDELDLALWSFKAGKVMR